MGPGDAAPLAKLVQCGIQQLGPADLLKPRRCQLAHDQLAAFVEQPRAVALTDQMDRGKTIFGNRRVVLPDLVPVGQSQTAQDASIVRRVQILAVDVRRRIQTVQGGFVFRQLLLAPMPEPRNAQRIGRQLQQQRTLMRVGKQ